MADRERVAWIGVDGLVLSVLDEPLAEAHVALSLRLVVSVVLRRPVGEALSRIALVTADLDSLRISCQS